jgi:uncharacterized protein YutE (UPF0331/DUF86 family)
MTNIEPVIIETRLELIGRYLDHLKKSEGISLDDYLSSFEQQLITERLLQLMTQAAIDINDHILSKLKPGKSYTKFEAFIELGKYQILTPELAKQIAPSSGLRNRLVHDIGPNQVFMALSFALQQYPLYVRQINSYLITLEEEND